ncbi:hypothetical protein CFSAN001679_22540 [Salmonella enterica subsp. enterica serovar Cerro str. CFSAN001679]|nr:hypothetical protein CFSAN001679_22540 [Salmonella enterica subsp. enterica serovar Cerro str. CFSAN001679]
MTYFFNRKTDYIKSLSGEEINSLQKNFEEACFCMPGFNSDKMNWGIIRMEVHRRHGKVICFQKNGINMADIKRLPYLNVLNP